MILFSSLTCLENLFLPKNISSSGDRSVPATLEDCAFQNTLNTTLLTGNHKSFCIHPISKLVDDNSPVESQDIVPPYQFISHLLASLREESLPLTDSVPLLKEQDNALVRRASEGCPYFHLLPWTQGYKNVDSVSSELCSLEEMKNTQESRDIPSGTSKEAVALNALLEEYPEIEITMQEKVKQLLSQQIAHALGKSVHQDMKRFDISRTSNISEQLLSGMKSGQSTGNNALFANSSADTETHSASGSTKGNFVPAMSGKEVFFESSDLVKSLAQEIAARIIAHAKGRVSQTSGVFSPVTFQKDVATINHEIHLSIGKEIREMPQNVHKSASGNNILKAFGNEVSHALTYTLSQIKSMFKIPSTHSQSTGNVIKPNATSASFEEVLSTNRETAKQTLLDEVLSSKHIITNGETSSESAPSVSDSIKKHIPSLKSFSSDPDSVYEKSQLHLNKAYNGENRTLHSRESFIENSHRHTISQKPLDVSIHTSETERTIHVTSVPRNNNETTKLQQNLRFRHAESPTGLSNTNETTSAKQFSIMSTQKGSTELSSYQLSNGIEVQQRKTTGENFSNELLSRVQDLKHLALHTPHMDVHGKSETLTTRIPIIDQIINHLDPKVRSQELQALTIQLEPRELGKVDVTMSLNQEGKLIAALRADSQHVVDILKTGIDQLRIVLSQYGIESESVSVEIGGYEDQSESMLESHSGSGHLESQEYMEEPEEQSPSAIDHENIISYSKGTINIIA